MTKLRAFSRLLLAGTALGHAGAALAQDAADENNPNVIIVTASKTAQDLQDVPMAVQALGTEKLEELGVSDLQDAIQFLPSATIQTAAPGFSQVYFRGVASGENANHSTSQPTVGTYLDEMPITTIQGALDIHAYDLARIEALAGPQGTLYGSSSMAGTIKMVTNQPDTRSNYGALDLEVNQVADGDMGGVLEGFYNFAITDAAAARLVAWYRKDGGYIDNILGERTYPTSGITDDNADLVEENYNDVDTYGARLALGIELNDSWTVRPTLMGQVQNVDGSFAQERSSAVNDDLQTVQYNPEFSKDRWVQAALTIEGKIGSWDLVATGGKLWRNDEVSSDYSDYSYFYDAIAGYGAYFYDDNGDYINPNQYIEGADRYRRIFGEIRVASPQTAPLRFIGGLFAQRQEHGIEQNYIIDNLTSDFVVPGTESNIWLTQQERTDRDYAAFGELSYDVTDKLTLLGGARVFRYKNSLLGFFGFSENYSSRTGVAACFADAVVEGSPCTNVDKTTAETDAIFKANATYKFSDDALVYATWSQGFRPGGVNRRGTLPPYQPDKLDNYELGWKTTMGALRFNGAVYQINWDRIQLSFLGLNGLSEVRNAGKARIRGVEMDLGYYSGGFTLNVGGSYNDSEITEAFCAIAVASFDCSEGVDLDGDGVPEDNAELAPAGTRLPVTPKFKGNAVARYEFPLGSWEGHVQGALAHIGNRRSDLRTQENRIKGALDGYTTFDMSFGVKRDALRFELFAKNLFDERGVVNTGVQCVEVVCGDDGNDTLSGGVFYDTVIKPRIIGIRAGIDF